MDQEQLRRAYEAGVELHGNAGQLNEHYQQTMAIYGSLQKNIYLILSAPEPPTDEQLERIHQQLALTETWMGMLLTRASLMRDTVTKLSVIMEGGDGQ